MVYNFSQQASLATALEKTFDGKHPCALCKQISKERKAGEKSQQQFEGKKLTLHQRDETIVLFPFVTCSPSTVLDDSAAGRSQPPLLPPPRPA